MMQQWLPGMGPELNQTVMDLLETGEITASYGQYVLLAGRKSIPEHLQLQSTVLQMLGQLSCSVERLTRALTALQYWMETSESENGRILLKNVSQHSRGYAKCLQVINAALVVEAYVELVGECL